MDPVYFDYHNIPATAFFQADDLIAADPELATRNEEVLQAFPRSRILSPDQMDPQGCVVRQHGADFVTIMTTDPEAYLTINDTKVFLGVGQFTFPTCAMRLIQLKIFHQGDVRAEYRNLDTSLANIFPHIYFMLECFDMNKKPILIGITYYTCHVTENCLLPFGYQDKPKHAIKSAKKLLEAGLLYTNSKDPK